MEATGTMENTIKRLLDMIEGAGQWKKTWKTSGMTIAEAPRNFITKREYNGMNALTLGLASIGYGCSEWATAKQVEAAGGTLCNGAAPHFVVLYLPYKKEQENKATGKKETKTRFLLREFLVYNISETSLYVPEKAAKMIRTKYSTARKVAAKYMKSEGIELKIGQPSYNPFTDVVKMPQMVDFDSEADYYNAFFHEVNHSTLGEKRCNRQTNGAVFGNAEYAKEELIAELGSVMLCLQTGVPANLENSAAYLASWKPSCEDDVIKDFGQVIKAAKKSSDFIMRKGGRE